MLVLKTFYLAKIASWSYKIFEQERQECAIKRLKSKCHTRAKTTFKQQEID